MVIIIIVIIIHDPSISIHFQLFFLFCATLTRDVVDFDGNATEESISLIFCYCVLFRRMREVIRKEDTQQKKKRWEDENDDEKRHMVSIMVL